MIASEHMLSSNKSLLVAMTPIADKATLIVDSGLRLEQAVTRNPGKQDDSARCQADLGNGFEEARSAHSRTREIETLGNCRVRSN